MAVTKGYSEYTYHDIIGYDYGNDKILMEGGRWIGVEYLRHLPRATQYANADPNKRLKILEEEGLKALDTLRNEHMKSKTVSTAIASYDLDTGKMRKAMEKMAIDMDAAARSMSPAMRELYKLSRSTPPAIRGKDSTSVKAKKKPAKKTPSPLASRLKEIGG